MMMFQMRVKMRTTPPNSAELKKQMKSYQPPELLSLTKQGPLPRKPKKEKSQVE